MRAESVKYILCVQTCLLTSVPAAAVLDLITGH